MFYDLKSGRFRNGEILFLVKGAQGARVRSGLRRNYECKDSHKTSTPCTQEMLVSRGMLREERLGSGCCGNCGYQDGC